MEELRVIQLEETWWEQLSFNTLRVIFGRGTVLIFLFSCQREPGTNRIEVAETHFSKKLKNFLTKLSQDEMQ